MSWEEMVLWVHFLHRRESALPLHLKPQERNLKGLFKKLQMCPSAVQGTRHWTLTHTGESCRDWQQDRGFSLGRDAVD